MAAQSLFASKPQQKKKKFSETKTCMGSSRPCGLGRHNRDRASPPGARSRKHAQPTLNLTLKSESTNSEMGNS